MNICFVRFIFIVNKINMINVLVDIEVDDFFIDVCQIDIYCIVIVVGFVKVDKIDIVG